MGLRAAAVPCLLASLATAAACVDSDEADRTSCVGSPPAAVCSDRDAEDGGPETPPLDMEGGAALPDASMGGGEVVGIPATMEGVGFASEDDRGSAYDPATCYDGEDNDDSGAVDCADESCANLGSCCVGSADCCATLSSPPLPSTLTIPADCPGMPSTGCLAGEPVTEFGDPGPRITDGVLYPGGDDSYDSGLLIGGSVDLSAMRAEVTTRFEAPSDCGASCLEGVGVAFTAQADFGPSTYVRPLVGLVSSGARGTVSLVVSDTTIRTWSLEENPGTWKLTLRPTGTAEVSIDGVPAGSARFPTIADARLVVYGRNRNPGSTAPNGSGISQLETLVELCDIPQAWRVRDELVLSVPPALSPLEAGLVRAPSVAVKDGRLALAYEQDNRIGFAVRGSEPQRFTVAAEEAFVTPGLPWNESGAEHPELLWDGSEWRLFYTAISAEDVRSIGVARSVDPSVTPFVSDDEPLLEPDGVRVVGYSSPAVVRLGYDHEIWILVVRADLADGSHQLQTFVSRDGGMGFARFEQDRLAELTTRGTSATFDGFDADEIAGPSIVVQNGAYHLYYAGRRGTRWRVGLLLSDELVHWRVLDGGAPVLEGDGSGADRLGVRDPDVFATGTTVELFYGGTDGAREVPFRALRSAGGR